jgi:ectoine hydroxylase-related dioxygenase (phytanoyl-CoA dioxygenase family)
MQGVLCSIRVSRVLLTSFFFVMQVIPRTRLFHGSLFVVTVFISTRVSAECNQEPQIRSIRNALTGKGYLIQKDQRSLKEVDEINSLFHEVKDSHKQKREVSPGRIHYDFLSSDKVRQHSLIHSMIQECESIAKDYLPDDKVQLTTLQIVNSSPGSQNQIWHADNKAKGLTLVIPLVDITTDEIGTTQFISGSHDLPSQLFQMNIVNPVLPKGSYLWLDCRVLHRGLANHSQVERPILVIRFDREDYPPPGMTWVGSVIRNCMGNIFYELLKQKKAESNEQG